MVSPKRMPTALKSAYITQNTVNKLVICSSGLCNYSRVAKLNARRTMLHHMFLVCVLSPRAPVQSTSRHILRAPSFTGVLCQAFLNFLLESILTTHTCYSTLLSTALERPHPTTPTTTLSAHGFQCHVKQPYVLYQTALHTPVVRSPGRLPHGGCILVRLLVRYLTCLAVPNY